MTDRQLFEKCKRNDARAQRALYDLFKAKLMGLARRYSKSREDAQDILQDAFIKIFSRIHQVESAEKLESWMKTITVHTAIDHYHRKKKDELVVYTGVDADVTIDEHEALSDKFLIELVSALPDGCRLVFNLFEVEGYNHTEIAAALNISEGTSRSQLYYAKYLLKKKISLMGINRYEKFA